MFPDGIQLFGPFAKVRAGRSFFTPEYIYLLDWFNSIINFSKHLQLVKIK